MNTTASRHCFYHAQQWKITHVCGAMGTVSWLLRDTTHQKNVTFSGENSTSGQEITSCVLCPESLTPDLYSYSICSPPHICDHQRCDLEALYCCSINSSSADVYIFNFNVYMFTWRNSLIGSVGGPPPPPPPPPFIVPGMTPPVAPQVRPTKRSSKFVLLNFGVLSAKFFNCNYIVLKTSCVRIS